MTTEPTEVSPELVAEIDATEPGVVIPDGPACLPWLEAADHALHLLGLDELHDELWGSLEHELTALEEARIQAEKMLLAVKEFLRDHGIPRLDFWFPCKVYGSFVQFTVKAAV